MLLVGGNRSARSLLPGGIITPRTKKVLRLAAQIIIVGAIFYFLGKKIRQDWPEITSRDWQFSYPWLVLSFILLSILYLGHACGWLIILWRFNHPVPFLPGLYVWFKSLLARYIPGNVVMVVGRVMMIEPYGVPKRASLTSVAYEQALLGASAATAIAIVLPFWPKLQNFSQMIWIVLIVPPLAIICLHPAILGRFGNYVFSKLKRETIEEFLPFMDVIGIFLFYCLFWIVAGLGMFAMVNTVTKIDLSDLPIIIASAPLAWLTSVLFFISPSGLGVREGVYAFTLDFAFESAGAAAAFAILVRFWQTLVELALVAIIMALVKIRHIKIRPGAATGALDDEEPETGHEHNPGPG
ncbi:MAG: flippase-like domain-containing protein [Thermoleophilia bacterium]|nr:flippase-like domain-containing protein [Thermoleophilia bacterium]